MILEHPALDRPAPPCACGRSGYTVRQMNLHPGQVWECYFCFDNRRFGRRVSA